MLSRALRLTLLTTLVALVAACGTTPKAPLPDPEIDGGPTAAFETQRTPQVVVEAVTGTGAAPAEIVRAAFYHALIERNYAPLRMDLGADAIPAGIGFVKVRIATWDRSEIDARGVIIVAGEASFVANDRPIWHVTFRNLAVRCVDPTKPFLPEEKDVAAAARIARVVLRTLPIKR